MLLLSLSLEDVLSLEYVMYPRSRVHVQNAWLTTTNCCITSPAQSEARLPAFELLASVPRSSCKRFFDVRKLRHSTDPLLK